MTILNPSVGRLQFTRFWNHNWVISNNINYLILNRLDLITSKFITYIFNIIQILKIYLLFSHTTICRTINNTFVYVFFYDNTVQNGAPIDLLFSSSVFSILPFNNFQLIDKNIDYDKLPVYYKFNNTNLISMISKQFVYDNNNCISMNKNKYFKFINQLLLKYTFLRYYKLNKSASTKTSLNTKTFLKLVQLYSIRSWFYHLRYKTTFDQDGKAKLKIFVRKTGVDSKTTSLSLTLAQLYLIIYKQISHLLHSTNVTIRFVNINNYQLNANVIASYAANRIRLFARPTSRQNKLTSAFFDFLFAIITGDDSVLGFKILVSGRINRRGRAMWKNFLYGQIPEGTLFLPLEFSCKSIKTINGVITVKVFSYRKYLAENKLTYSNLVSVAPGYYINKDKFLTDIDKCNELPKLIEPEFTKMVIKKTGLKRRLKKLKKALSKNVNFGLL